MRPRRWAPEGSGRRPFNRCSLVASPGEPRRGREEAAPDFRRALAAAVVIGRDLRWRGRRSGERRAGRASTRISPSSGRTGSSRKIRLTIRRNTTTWRSRPLGTSFFSRPRLTVRDLDADGEHEVRVDTYTGGAHCCFQTRFFRWLPGREEYGMTFRNWPRRRSHCACEPRPPGRHSSCSPSDARFGYRFTAFAASPFPVQIWEFDAGRLRDVTRLPFLRSWSGTQRSSGVSYQEEETKREMFAASSLPGRPTSTSWAARTRAGWSSQRARSAATSRGRTASGRLGVATCACSARFSSRRATPSADR